jgi:hypothetical protein
MKMKLILIFFISLPGFIPAQILLHDPFDDNSKHWFTGENADAVFKIDSGVYQINSPGTMETQPLDTIISQAFYASCSARLLKGVSKASYGFFLQSLDRNIDRKIFLLINSAGFYSCFIQKPDGTFPLARWTASPVILKNNLWNTVAFTGDSAKLNLYINDFYIRTFDNPFFHYNYAGVTSFDTSIVEFNEIIVFAYPKLDKILGVDYYNLPEVLTYLLKAQPEGFTKIKGKELASADKKEKLYEAKLWIPGFKEVFISNKSYKAIFNSYTSIDEVKENFYLLRNKLQQALPDAAEKEGLDENDLPYILLGNKIDEIIQHPLLDLAIVITEDTDKKKLYNLVLEIE